MKRNPSHLISLFGSLLIASTLLVGCTTDGGAPSDAPMGQQEEGTANVAGMPKISGELGQEPRIIAPEGNPPSELVTEDVFVGSGA